MKKELILTAIIASAITLSISTPIILQFSNKSNLPLKPEILNTESKYINTHEKELDIATSEATTKIIQYFNLQDLDPLYTNPNIYPIYFKIPFYDIPVKKCYVIKTSVFPSIKTIFLDKENLTILYNNLYFDLVNSKPKLEKELDSMYLNKNLINSGPLLKGFIEKYSLFNNIKNYKKLGDSLCGALIFQYGNLETEGKLRYSCEYFFK